MPSLADLVKEKLKEKENIPEIQEKEIIIDKSIDKPIKEKAKTSKITKSKKAIKKEAKCPNCNRPFSISQDKKMNKDDMILWLNKYIKENKELFPLDFLRSQKLIFESIAEMRK